MNDDEDLCGEARDHDEVVTYQDEELIQFRCELCGAEFEEEKEPK